MDVSKIQGPSEAFLAGQTEGRYPDAVRDTGGSAFPDSVAVGPAGDVYGSTAGMSLRDYFAAKAMQALIQTDQMDSHVAYLYADQMLLERAK